MPGQNKPPANPQRRDAAPGRRTPSSAGTRAQRNAGTHAPGGTPLGTIGGGQYVGEEHTLGFDAEGLHIPTGNSELLLSRRQLLFGAAGVAAAAVVGGVAASIGGQSDGGSAENALAVGTGEVFTLDDCVETPIEDALTLVGEYKLPYGSLVWAGNDTIAACLLPTESSKPLVTAALLNLTTGNQATVLEQAVGQDEGFEIYDMRASDEGAIWTEANILTGEWRVYVSQISMMTLPEQHQVDSGDSSQETPTLAAMGGTAFWQVVPAVSESADDGSADGGETVLRCVAFSKPGDVRSIYTADGRCATAISPANEQRGIVMTPADPDAKSHRKMILVNESGQVEDEITLPSRMTPMEACYGATGFAFSFESIYNYGEGIANLGTYTPREKPASGSYSHGEWFRFARTPNMPPAWCGDWFLVKSTSAVVAVHLGDKRYAIIPTDTNAEVYGDCLASLGTNDTVVTFTNIDRTSAVQDNEQVTDDDRLCMVRVWSVPDASADSYEASQEPGY